MKTLIAILLFAAALGYTLLRPYRVENGVCFPIHAQKGQFALVDCHGQFKIEYGTIQRCALFVWQYR